MTREQATEVKKYLTGNSQYGLKSLGHLDEVVPKDSPFYEEAVNVSQWFRENGTKKVVSTPKSIEEFMAKLVSYCAEISKP